MKYPGLLSIGLAIALSLCLAAPMNAQAASKSTQTSSKKVAKKTKSSQKTSEKSLKSQKRNKRLVAAKKSDRRISAKKDKKSSRNSRDDRQIWLKRAQDGELLTGKASWYGRDFHSKATASGHNYDMYTFTAAHRTLPMGTVVRVTDQHNGKSVMVCVTDRGPFVRGRIIDLSYAAARQLDLNKRGVGRVNLEVVSDATGKPLKDDHAYYVRYKAAKGREKVGPFKIFADAAAMHEALSQAHPEAELVLDNAR